MQVYIHIPFCTSKCRYCRFASYSSVPELQIASYVQFLCREIENSPFIGKTISTLYFGGGTPSTLSPEQLEQIFISLQKVFVFDSDIEITLESTPEKISMEHLQAWSVLGINRISIGIQSLNKKTLYEVARYHKGDILESFDILETFYQKNKNIVINLDFIIGLPFVKQGELAKDIVRILRNYSFVSHLSVYMLEDYFSAGETDSAFEQISYPADWKDSGLEEKFFLKEYAGVKKLLHKYGFFSYEISNFAKKGKHCRHNVGYWNHAEVAAFGLGASGFIGGERYTHSERFLDYYGQKNTFKEQLTDEDLRIEKIMFGLRTHSLKKELLSDAAKKTLPRFEEAGRLIVKNGRISLSDAGVLQMDAMLAELV